MPDLTFRKVTKAFEDGTVAVDGLDLAIEHGEFLVLVGPSGCGKTTSLTHGRRPGRSDQR